MSWYRFAFLLVIAQVGQCETVEPVNKRLLLTDPDILSQRLDQYDRTQADLKQLVNTLSSTLQTLKTENANLKQTVTALQAQGSTYVRWGRTICAGSNTETVYKGYAAGQYYSSTNFGGPANMLCMPENPNVPSSSYTGHDIYLYGTEYQSSFAAHAANEDVPCAVCRNNHASTSVMIPGRQTCYSGWNVEYHGVLASGHANHTASEFICVDSHPEFVVSGKANQNGKLLYIVNTKCGPLPCPPYEDQRKINCVVCSE